MESSIKSLQSINQNLSLSLPLPLAVPETSFSSASFLAAAKACRNDKDLYPFLSWESKVEPDHIIKMVLSWLHQQTEQNSEMQIDYKQISPSVVDISIFYLLKVVNYQIVVVAKSSDIYTIQFRSSGCEENLKMGKIIQSFEPFMVQHQIVDLERERELAKEANERAVKNREAFKAFASSKAFPKPFGSTTSSNQSLTIPL
jgi:hypothetical protein